MKPYDVGYGRPPRHTQFKKGECPNPRGRGKSAENDRSASVLRILSEAVEYGDGRKRKIATRQEVAIRKLFHEALRGDIRSANDLLVLRAHAQRPGGALGPMIIELHNDPELGPGETREQWLPRREER
jgi:Family of unknown function (DUF5681)